MAEIHMAPEPRGIFEDRPDAVTYRARPREYLGDVLVVLVWIGDEGDYLDYDLVRHLT